MDHHSNKQLQAMRKTHKSGIGILAILCLHTSILAQQSYGMQNHPAPKRLRESLGLDIPWSPQMSWITLLLVGAALIAWTAYFFTVARMYRDRQSDGPKPSMSAPTNANYPWHGQLANRGKFPLRPSLAGVDHKDLTDNQPDLDRESEDTVRGS